MGERVSITMSSWWESFKRTVRWTNWYNKIPLFMVAMYYAGLRSDLDADRLLLLYGLLLAFACASGCYGYMVNDLFDQSVDRIVGKPNVLAGLSQPVAIALVAASCALGLIIAVPLLSTAVSVALVIVTYGLITAYSAPPVRFKERGVGALLVVTATQRTLPALIIFHTLGVWDLTTIIFSAFISVTGIHAMTAHQIMDAENDRRSGVRTLAVDRGTEALYQVLKYLVFVEVICLTLFIIAMAIALNMLAILGMYGVWLLVAILNRTRLRLGKPTLGEPSVSRLPLDVFSEVVLPLVLAVALVSQNFLFVPVLVFTVLLLRPRIVWEITNIKRLVRSGRLRRRIIRQIIATNRLVRGRLRRRIIRQIIAIKRLVRGHT